MSLRATTWQTVGPYFPIGLEHLYCKSIAVPGQSGEHFAITGRVLDGVGQPIPDAVIEIWQADAKGEYRSASHSSSESHADPFSGFGRIPTDELGRFSFATIRPGPVPGPHGAMQSPHLAVRLMMRGLLRGLVTRMYFPAESLASDPVLQLVPERRRGTLIAAPDLDNEAALIWNIEMQGERETVFFDC
jgi:protocatechuate 3,4-dioxygenase, alpha subunit